MLEPADLFRCDSRRVRRRALSFDGYHVHPVAQVRVVDEQREPFRQANLQVTEIYPQGDHYRRERYTREG